MALIDTIKFCTNCGHPIERREESGRVRPVCPNCGHIYYFAPLVAVAVILQRDDGKILIVRRGENPGKGWWGLPGGYVETDETIEHALLREIREETGLELLLEEVLGVWSFYHDSKQSSGAVIIYCAHAVGGTLLLASDSTEAEWVAPEDAENFALAFDTHRDALRQWKASIA